MAFFGLLIVLDQFTKYAAETYLKGIGTKPVIPGVFELFYLQNRGAAFGILANRQWVFVMIALAMVAVAIYVYVYLPVTLHFLAMRICLWSISQRGWSFIRQQDITAVRLSMRFCIIAVILYPESTVYCVPESYIALIRIRPDL